MIDGKKLVEDVRPETIEKELKKEMRKPIVDTGARLRTEMVLGAIRWMKEHPEAGVVRWTEGEQYVWREDEAGIAQ